MAIVRQEMTLLGQVLHQNSVTTVTNMACVVMSHDSALR